MKLLPLTLALTALILGTTAYAAPEFGKPIVGKIILNKPATHTTPGFNYYSPPATKTIILMNLKLNTQEKQAINSFNPETSTNNQKSVIVSTPQASLPSSIDQGMNGVPVLDQGLHGSCVTFATTAAIDALLGKGDYISQLCSLQLGTYFEQKAYLDSGWNGSLGPIVLNQIMGFGIINKIKQKEKSCGGLKDYPTRDSNYEGSPMNLDEFKQSSENLNENMYWDPILTVHQRLAWGSDSAQEAKDLLLKIKTILSEKKRYSESRLIFAALLPSTYCSVGACGRHNAQDDTWVLTAAIKNDTDAQLGGHEMIITGYDDYATAVDNDGKTHRGLLILRNSWSEEAGDHGNYYMSYDFFKKYIFEVHKVVIEK